MQKFFLIFLVIFVSCSGESEDGNQVLETNETTTTTVADTTTTTVPETTTTTVADTTTTTVPETTTTTVADTTTTTVPETTTTTVADTTNGYQIISDSYFDPFTRYVDINGLRIFVTQEVSNDFIQKVSDTYLILNETNSYIDNSLRNSFYATLNDLYVFQRIGFLGPDYYVNKTGKNFDDALSPSPINGPYDENVTDYIWEVPDANTNSQIGEVVEHLLHTITNVAFARSYPDWNWYDPTSKIRLATNEAIEKNIFNVSDYEDIKNRGDEEGYHKITTQEFTFWFVVASWGYADIYELPSEEFTLSNKDQVMNQLPIAYELYEEFINKILNPPSTGELNNIFKN